jgi:hypothetical protein
MSSNIHPTTYSPKQVTSRMEDNTIANCNPAFTKPTATTDMKEWTRLRWFGFVTKLMVLKQSVKICLQKVGRPLPRSKS